jgi:hypothetical protein
MPVSFRNLILPAAVSDILAMQAFSERFLPIYVNEQPLDSVNPTIQIEAKLSSAQRENWDRLAAELLLHDRIQVSAMDIEPEVKFDKGLRVQIPLRPGQKNTLCTTLTQQPSLHDWLSLCLAKMRSGRVFSLS